VYQLSFWVEVKKFAERRIEENKQKHFPTEEDLNPNMKFVNNRILNALDDNKHLMSLEEKYKINWADSREDFIRKLYVKLTETPEYQEYMSNGKDSFSDDKRFLDTVIDTYMPENGLLFDYYSDRDLSFNSDYQLAIYLLWKFVDDLSASFDASTKLPPIYKAEEDDKEFVIKLFEKTILHSGEYRELVSANISNWDYDRLALMDKILIFMALTEFCEFHSIPVKVTINEYIEISKFYSTPESRRFVNGMLDKLASVLKENGKLVKTGMGLIDK
jgi:N utilization substance protein B